MKTIKRALLPAIFSFLMADAIEVSPATLDFGNVLMGNTPTMTFTVTMNLEQTVTITAPNFFSVDITEIQATEGLIQDIVVTFSPPSIGTYNSYVTLTGSVFGSAAVAVDANAVNNIEGSLSGTISADYSPYEVSGDIYVSEGDTLIIDPGVELQFSGFNSFDVFGTLIVNGDPDSLVRFNASDSNVTGWKGLYFEDSDSSFMQYAIIEDVGYVHENDMETGQLEDDWEDHSSGSTSQYEYSNSYTVSGDSALRIFNSGLGNNNYGNYVLMREVLPNMPGMKISFWVYYDNLTQFYVKLLVNNNNSYDILEGYFDNQWFSGECSQKDWCYVEINPDESPTWTYIGDWDTSQIIFGIHGIKLPIAI